MGPAFDSRLAHVPIKKGLYPLVFALWGEVGRSMVLLSVDIVAGQ